MTETNPEYVYESMNDAEPTAPEQPMPLYTEAPAVIFTQLYAPKGGQVVQFNLTCRGNSVREAIDALVDGINYAKTKGFSVIRPMGETPAVQPATTHVNAPQTPVTAPVPVNVPASPATPALSTNNSVKTIHAVRMDVQPKPDGKVTLEWYADGHKFADIYTTRTVENAVNLLSATGAWTPEHLGKAQSFTVTHIITWKDSEKLNSKGNPYKDLINIANG